MMELSVQPPPFTDKLPLPSRQFFLCVDESEARSGSASKLGSVADQLFDKGAISPVSPTVTFPLDGGGGRKALAVELMLDYSQMVVDKIGGGERRRLAEDEERFLSNTYIMHLGL